MASPNTRKSQKEDIAKGELYNTPNIALESFYTQYPEVFDRYDVYYDPCNGLGAIADYLKSIGKKVYTADLNHWGHSDYEGFDFLECSRESLPSDVQCIIFNPPFTLTEAFVDKAVVELDTPLLMFNRMTTIESKSRAKKFHSGQWKLLNMYQFAFRVSCSKGVGKDPTANSVAYSWFDILPKKYILTTPARLNWII